MTRSYPYSQVDVFTDQPLTGNPLAVFLEPEGLSDAEMQAIAGELNLSETTFVFPPNRVRIFTPARELPFAGHPTIGTAYVLAKHGRRQDVLEEKIGPVPLTYDGDLIWMRHRPAELEPPLPDREGIAQALGLTPSDLHPTAPVQVGSTGNRFLFVPLRDRAAVDRAVSAPVPQTDTLGVFVVAAEPPDRAYGRMFAPAAGLVEDPATGSAAGPLGAYLRAHGLLSADRVVVEQGTKMGRRSLIHVRLADGIEVGGQTVDVLEGVITLPERAGQTR